ncbi:ABC transporter permease [uncultured Hoeflea sp.]|uniref:ABC transporter permease n=1 Tax=uncultured Hoeflea sp. TaxID=538666 RepID=UPI0026284E2B|nr:ABC transporter permease [uncultured Hoeflea sp.]
MTTNAQTPQRLLSADLLAGFWSSKVAVIAAFVFVFMVVLALAAPWISPQDPYDLSQLNLLDSRLAPFEKGIDGTVYLLGTDQQGRDMFSAILHGLRISLFVAVVSSVTALVIGTSLGILSGMRRGWLDTVLMRIVDVQLSIPAVLVSLVLLAVLGRGIDKIIFALITVQWVYFARTARAATLVEMSKDYVEAAQSFGFSRTRIMFWELLPNVLPPLLVVAMVEFAHAIALEATLSFLGVGLPITEPSLGLLISTGFAYLQNGEYWISLFPGIALLLLVFNLNLVAEWFRESLDSRRR